MATKRQAIAQLSAEDLKLVADALEAHVGKSKGKEFARIRRAAKILRSVQPSAATKKAG